MTPCHRPFLVPGPCLRKGDGGYMACAALPKRLARDGSGMLFVCHPLPVGGRRNGGTYTGDWIQRAAPSRWHGGIFCVPCSITSLLSPTLPNTPSIITIRLHFPVCLDPANPVMQLGTTC
jgi:hypothetical protein